MESYSQYHVTYIFCWFNDSNTLRNFFEFAIYFSQGYLLNSQTFCLDLSDIKYDLSDENYDVCDINSVFFRCPSPSRRIGRGS